MAAGDSLPRVSQRWTPKPVSASAPMRKQNIDDVMRINRPNRGAFPPHTVSLCSPAVRIACPCVLIYGGSRFQ